MTNDSGKKTMESPETKLRRKPKRLNNSRRSFAKAGLIAPVMLSLANRPAWGASFRCTVSGFDSLATIGSGPALTDIEAMCNYMSVDDVLGDMSVDLDQLVKDIFPSCVNSETLTVGMALNDNGDAFTQRMVAAYFNPVNPFGNDSVEDVYCHVVVNGAFEPYSFRGVILHGLEIHNFLGFIGIK